MSGAAWAFTLALCGAVTPRVALVVEASGPESDAAAGAVSTALHRALVRDLNAVVVDAGRLRRLRAAGERRAGARAGSPAGDPAGGSSPASELVTSADADLTLAVEVETRLVSSPLLPELAAVGGRATARLTTTDDGARLAEAEAMARAPASGDRAAGARKTGTRLAEALWRELEPALRASGAPARVEVVVESAEPLATADTERVLAALRAIDGVGSARAVRRTPRRLQIDAAGAGLSTEKLASALERAPAAGLAVRRFSARTLVLELRTGAVGQVGLALAPVEVSRLPRREAAALARLVAAPLFALDFIGRAEGPAEAPLTLSVRMARAGRGRRLVEARLGRPRAGEEASATCPEGAELTACLHELGTRLAARLRELRGRGELEGLSASPVVLEAGEVRSPGLFPSFLGRYAVHPVAHLEVRNPRDEVVRVSWTAAIPGHTSAPRGGPRPLDIEPGAQVELPLFIQADAEALTGLDSARPVTLEVHLDVQVGPWREQMRLARSILAHDTNALDWRIDEGQPFASFIDGRDPAVAALAEAALGAVPEDLAKSPFAEPAALAHALRHLVYRADPKHPFRPDRLDFVRYPRETLVAGKGDCDDLTVALASLAEAAGHDVLVLLTPGHVLPAFGLGLPPDRRPAVALADHALFEHAGQLYLPLEATSLAEGFLGAWRAAERELAELGGAGLEPGVVHVAAVRSAYPAAGLRRGPPLAAKLDREALRAELERARAARDREMDAELARLRAEQRSEAANALGVLLAQLGRLEEAEGVFRDLAGRARGVAPQNNLGAVALLRADGKRALEVLLEAANRAPDEPRVQMNAILAALAVGDESPLDDLLVRLEPEVLRPFWRRVTAFRSLRGAAGAARFAPLARRLAALGLDVSPGQVVRAGRTAVAWSELVYWIR